MIFQGIRTRRNPKTVATNNWPFMAFLLFAMCSCQDNGRVKRTYVDGRLIKETHFLEEDGILKQYVKFYDSLGNISQHAEVQGAQYEGISRKFYPNGNLKISGSYSFNLPHGDFIEYFESGDKQREYIQWKGKYFRNYTEYDQEGRISEYRFYGAPNTLTYRATYSLDGNIKTEKGGAPIVLYLNDSINLGDTIVCNIRLPKPPSTLSSLEIKLSKAGIGEIDSIKYEDNSIDDITVYKYCPKSAGSYLVQFRYNRLKFGVIDTSNTLHAGEKVYYVENLD